MEYPFKRRIYAIFYQYFCQFLRFSYISFILRWSNHKFVRIILSQRIAESFIHFHRNDILKSCILKTDIQSSRARKKTYSRNFSLLNHFIIQQLNRSQTVLINWRIILVNQRIIVHSF